jgi:hypothetical protein
MLDPGLEMQKHTCFCCCKKMYPNQQCNFAAFNMPPDAGLQKKDNFSTFIIGLDKTGNQTKT